METAKSTKASKPSIHDRMPTKQFEELRDAQTMALSHIELERIERDPNQPRQHFDKDAIEGLAESIQKRGLLQPIRVRKHPDKPDCYIIVSGERRYRAMQLNGAKKIPVTLATGDHEIDAIVENIQREDLKPIEEALALKKLREKAHVSNAELGRMIGKKTNTVGEILSILELPEYVFTELDEHPNISKSALIALAKVKNPDDQKVQWVAMKQGRFTVAAARASAKGEKPPSEKTDVERAIDALRKATMKVAKLPSVNDEELKAIKGLRTELSRTLKEKEAH